MLTLLPTKRVHFFENHDRQRKLFETETTIVYGSGYWYRFGKSNAEKLIGGCIFFHTSQSDISKEGGIILGFREAAMGERQQSLVIIYETPKANGERQLFVAVEAEPGRWYGGGGNWKITGI